ncbi:MAG: class I SAM-dependent methyltransferase [Verrucomicrobiota bacterium]
MANISHLTDGKLPLGSFRSLLERLQEQGGPNPGDYLDLNDLLDGLYSAIQAGRISMEEIRAAWAALGDAGTSPNTCQGFVWCKPHGYAGDFEIIERIYQHWISPDANLARWDHYFHSLAAPQAVRNRKDYFHNWLRQKAAHNGHREKRILNLASGPGRDLFEWCTHDPQNGFLFDCVDSDANAIQYANNLCAAFSERIVFHHNNAFRFWPHQQPHLIWSGGLFDYLDDQQFSRLLCRLYRFLAPAGEMVVGNFSAKNPTRCYMEIGNWLLNHRSSDQLKLLARQADIPDEAIQVKSEPLNVNLFLHVTKPAS